MNSPRDLKSRDDEEQTFMQTHNEADSLIRFQAGKVHLERNARDEKLWTRQNGQKPFRFFKQNRVSRSHKGVLSTVRFERCLTSHDLHSVSTRHRRELLKKVITTLADLAFQSGRIVPLILKVNGPVRPMASSPSLGISPQNERDRLAPFRLPGPCGTSRLTPSTRAVRLSPRLTGRDTSKHDNTTTPSEAAAGSPP